MSKQYMRAFREARQAMGFVQTSAYIPADKLEDFSLFVDRLKAERMVEICETMLPTSRERRALASRNVVVDLPTHEAVRSTASGYKSYPTIRRMANELLERLESAASTMNVAKATDDDEDALKWMSWAVAHNHMAAVMWKELLHAAKQLEEQSAA